MILVNETGVGVTYWISAAGQADCGSIDVDGVADLPAWDNQQNVEVSFLAADGSGSFSTTWPATKTDEQTEIALLAE
jgi:hypothetical protein